jgi:hypothetical protein
MIMNGGPDFNKEHGLVAFGDNTPPHNRTSDELRDKLLQLLTLYTRFDPEKNEVRMTHADAATLPKLH